MKITLKILLLLIFLGSRLAAQNTAPGPTPTPKQEDVVKISTNLIQVDVTVTDSNGKIITDLKPEEIEIYENGKKQKVTNFSFVSSNKPLPPSPSGSSKIVDKVPVPQPMAVIPQQSSIRRTIAIVIDDLSMSWESVAFTKEALKKFVAEQVQEGDLVAILRTGGSIGTLQRFTTDKDVLYAAIKKIKYNPMGTGGVTAFEPLEPTGTQTLSLGMGGLPGDGDAQTEAFLATAESRRAAIFTSGTLGALSYVVAGMKELPGRKSVVLFSDGFDLFERDKDGTPSTGLAMLGVRKLIEEANRAAVVFYPIDPRGLQVGLFEAADNTRGMKSREILSAVSTRRQRVYESQNGVNFLARETGGFATFNNNNLYGGMRRALEDQTYYLVGYVPDTDTFDPATSKYNKLDVKVLRKGAAVRYRSGFFGVTDTKKIVSPIAANSKNYVSQLKEALLSPFVVNGITLRLNSLFGSTDGSDLYVRSLLYLDANDLSVKDEPNGDKTCSFEVLAASFGPAGELVDQIGKTFTMTVKPDIYKQILTQGLIYHFKFPAKKGGGYQYRVAIRDAASGKLGAASQFVQVPDLKAGKLTLSSIVLEDMSVDDFQNSFAIGSAVKTDPMTDTAVRRIKVGRVYRYSFEAYNAQLDDQKRTNLETRIRVFREGKLILDGQPKPFVYVGAIEPGHLRTLGGLSIGSEMEPGDYILQVIVTDNFGKQKRQVATQFVQFEVAE